MRIILLSDVWTCQKSISPASQKYLEQNSFWRSLANSEIVVCLLDAKGWKLISQECDRFMSLGLRSNFLVKETNFPTKSLTVFVKMVLKSWFWCYFWFLELANYPQCAQTSCLRSPGRLYISNHRFMWSHLHRSKIMYREIRMFRRTSKKYRNEK